MSNTILFYESYSKQFQFTMVFWVVIPASLVGSHQRLGGTYSLHFQQPPTRPHDVTTHKIISHTLIAVRTSNLVQFQSN